MSACFHQAVEWNALEKKKTNILLKVTIFSFKISLSIEDSFAEHILKGKVKWDWALGWLHRGFEVTGISVQPNHLTCVTNTNTILASFC